MWGSRGEEKRRRGKKEIWIGEGKGNGGRDEEKEGR